jgi:hypothetical protein
MTDQGHWFHTVGEEGRKEPTLWRASKGLKLNFLLTYNCDNQTGYQKTYHVETQNSPPAIVMMVTTLHQAWSTAKTDVCAIVSSLWIFYIRVQLCPFRSCCQQLPGQPIRIILFLWLLLIYLLYSLALPWSSSPPLLLTAVHNNQAAILRLDQATMDTFWNQSQQQKQYYMSQGLQF